ncbi:MAG: M43 family zinc metalloprotease [Chitinophagales bacterium]
MKKFLLAGMVLLATVYSYSQATIRCGVNSYLKTLEQSFPEEYASIMATKEEIKARTSVTTTYKSNGTVYTIPVVVHVVYKTTAQNIDDEFIFSQIDVLNADYRRTNDDADETPTAFEGVAADAEIEFCLAQQDEDGIITTGITRTETDISSWNLFADVGDEDFSDNVKFSDEGGEDGWNRSDYLNIWVCNLVGGLLGYATFPGGAASKDGVVIAYKYFGEDSPGGVYDKGRTATHEVGHWLGLFHIWGDDDFSPDPQCGGTDEIADTPNQEDATFGSPAFPKLDDCSPSSPGIMFMNYMDYTDDGSMNMFTDDQAEVMHDVLESNRSTIPESIGCEQGVVAVNEVLKNKLIQLSVYPNPSSDEFVFEMKNFENNELTVEVYNLTGEMIDRISLINSGDENVVFDASALSAGDYLVKASDGEFILTQKITVIR